MPEYSILTPQQIIRSFSGYRVLLLAGPAASGKTTLARTLADLSGAANLRMDHYLLETKDIKLDFSQQYGWGQQWDSPDSIEFKRLRKDLIDLSRNGHALIPIYNFPVNLRAGNMLFTLDTDQPLIVEGVHALRLRELFTDMGLPVFSIFMDATARTRLDRVRERNRVEHKTIDENLLARRFHYTRLGEKKWVLPLKKEADWCIFSYKDFSLRLHNTRKNASSKRRG